MKIPLEWLSEYVKINKPVKEIASDFTALGLMLDKYDEQNNVLDLEHRMDRSDWLSIIGCARDLAAFNKLELKYPKLYTNTISPIDRPDQVEIKVEGTTFVNRFYTHIIKNTIVKESPDWLKSRLEKYGLPSINNIVDITNYVMVEYGQPMHAHDLDKMQKYEIEFRYARKGEKIITLLGQEIELDETMYITSNNGQPTGIAGIVGGKAVAIDKDTKNIVLDSGNYNQNQIRKTSRKLKIMNETVLRTDKFLHPHNNELAVKRATQLILELAGGEVYKNGDYYPNVQPLTKQTLRYERILKIGGLEIEENIIEDILTRLEYKILSKENKVWDLEVPYFRTDVQVEDDIVADILRINDYANIPSAELTMAPPVEITPKEYKLEQQLKDDLTRLGLDEHITAPFVHINNELKDQIVLLGTISKDRQALRTSVFETLKSAVYTYQKHGIQEVALFEIGNAYHKVGVGDKYEDYKEVRELEIIYINEKLSVKENTERLRSLLAGVLATFGIHNYELVKLDNQIDIVIDNVEVGVLYYDHLTFYLQSIFEKAGKPIRVISEIPNYTSFDISLVLPLTQAFGEIYQEIKRFNENIVNLEVTEEYIGDKVEADKKALLVQITYSDNKKNDLRMELLKYLVNTFGISHRS